MGQRLVLVVLALLVIQFKAVKAESDVCSINKCQCTRRPNMTYDDVNCFVTSVTAADFTVTDVPLDVQSLTLSCHSLSSLSFLSDGIFENRFSLRSLTIYQCNIRVLTAGSFRGLISLINLTISDSVLPLLDGGTFLHLQDLRFLTIVSCNLSNLPDISSLKSLQYLNISYNNLHHVEIENCVTSGRTPTRTKTGCLDNLRIIDLSYNNISSTPLSLISNAPRVQELYLTGLSLTQLVIPEHIELKDLTILDAKLNHLQVVYFPGFGTSTGIKELRLEGTGLTLSFQSMSHLINMEELSLNNFAINDTFWNELNSTVLARLNMTSNNLTTIEIGQLPALRLLHLAKNRISVMSDTTFVNQPNLKLVNLSQNAISSLPPNLFKNNYNLQVLDLSSNNISGLPFEFIKGLNQLWYLDLSNNFLASLPLTVLKDVSSMKYLYLRGNKLMYLPNVSIMPELIILDISHNQIYMISPDQLSGLNKLKSLLANDNKLTRLAPNLLSQCPDIRLASFQNNYISDIGTLGAHPNLQTLILDNNQLRYFTTESPFIQLSSLAILSLDGNNLTTIKYNMFPPSLETLFLNKNPIIDISSSSFRGLPRLSFVSLSNNKEPLLIPISAVNVFKNHSPKPTFFVERNIFWCSCDLGYLKVISEDKFSIPVFKIYYPQFEGLNNSKCYTPSDDLMRPFKDADLSHFLCVYTVTWCDFVCNCCSQAAPCKCAITCPRDCTCMYGGSAFAKTYINIYCRSKSLEHVPSDIPSRTVQLYLDGNKFGHLSKRELDHLLYVEDIYLNSSGIRSMDNGTFDTIDTLKTLYLNDNLLTEVAENMFGRMKKVTQIYLHNNLINNISPEAFSDLPAATTITLHNNRLVFLKAVMQIPHPLTLTLSENPWACNCNVSNVIIRTIYEINEAISDVDKMCCYFYDNVFLHDFDAQGGTLPRASRNSTVIASHHVPSMTDTEDQLLNEENSLISSELGRECLSLMRFNYVNHCTPKAPNSTYLKHANTGDLHPGFAALIVITIILLLMASAVLLVIFKRHELQALIFVKLGVRILDKKAHIDKEDAVLKAFDAFISYSSKDEEFVASNLVPALENGDRKYRLCVHYRDFPVGRNITDTIYRAIQNSSRTILLLSVNFLSSEWCRFEFQTAHHYILREGSHRLIVVIFGDIPDEMLDPDLKVHLKSKTYLRYGDPWFWEKMYFALPSFKDRHADRDCHADILRGMRILAGDEEADEAPNLSDRQHPAAQAIIEQGLNIFDQNHKDENAQGAQTNDCQNDNVLGLFANDRKQFLFFVNTECVQDNDDGSKGDLDKSVKDIETDFQ